MYTLITHRVFPEQLHVGDVFGLEGCADRLGKIVPLEVSITGAVPDPQIGSPLLTLASNETIEMRGASFEHDT